MDSIVLIEFHGYPEIYRLEDGQLRGQDCFEVRPVMPDDELMARQTEKGFWIKWEINSKEEMVYELEV